MPGKNIKDLFKQLETLLKKDKKKTFIVVVCVFIILAGLIYIIKLNYNFIKESQNKQEGQQSTVTDDTGQPDAAKTSSTFLPELKRKMETGQEVRDPFNVALKLKGIINGGYGGDLAIIEAGNTAYVVKVGEELQGGWKVKEIKKNAVILTAGNQSLELKFNGRVNVNPNNNQNAAQNSADQKQPAGGQGSDGN
ncbi:type II secretion system protein N [Desulfotruncus alcoholivorax]|uniref:type II secretion system protein N n=1 Tax=Desulfotruncus alcoholivorax TaxID=265477 RepID=UPI0003FF419B|nr:type II secretion system protein N [Desulfotruncus alcoholivorax]